MTVAASAVLAADDLDRMDPHDVPIGTLAVPAAVVDAAATCEDVERRFLDDPELGSVVVRRGGGWATVTRSRFLTRFAGRLGHGRALYARRPLPALGSDVPALVLPAGTDVVAAGRLAVERPAAHRHDDLVVPGPDGPRTVAFAALLSATAALHAQRAVSDPLTGLANRRLVLEELQGRLDREEEDVCLLFVDVDDFKAVNDSLGHPVGDALLVAVARRLRDAFRDDDVVARLGGDEFIVLARLGDEQEAQRAADRIRLALAVPIDLTEGRGLPVRCSVGVVLRRDETDAEDLLRAADIAMYAAKRDGKGGSSFFRPDMHEAALARLDLRSTLPTAVSEGQLHLVHQPVVDLATGAVVAVEALARWRHPQRGTVPPAVFIPLAEELGVVGTIGRHVLTTGLGELQRLDAAVRLAVNASVLELESAAYAEEVLAALDRAGVTPSRLTVEVTETALTSDSAAVMDALHRLSAAGVAIAIDDFGTGHSTLARLDRLPIDVLKLDKALVDPLAQRPDRGLVEGLIRLARALRLDVIAEGIETPAQHRRLLKLGCPFGQGYRFGRPVPVGELVGASPGRTAVPAG